MTVKEMFDYFVSKGLTPEGAAGLMGNLKAESNLSSINLQNTYEKKFGLNDREYTDAVDSGRYTNFVHDKAGYGLAQWTFWSRKQNFLNYARSKGASIGDCEMQMEFLCHELKGYTSVYACLIKTKSIREASDIVLLQYERPADQSEAVKKKRAEYGQAIYNQCAKAVVVPDNNTDCEEFYPKYAGKSIHVDEVLSAIGVPAKYIGTWAKRKPLAMKQGIENYKGSMSQNMHLIALARQGKLMR